MSNIQVSQELLRQFAYDCFDVIVAVRLKANKPADKIISRFIYSDCENPL